MDPSPAEYIDSHVHILPPARLRGLMKWMHRAFPGHPVPSVITPDGIIADLRAAGATRFINLVFPLNVGETDSLNAWNLEFCENTPGAVPVGSLHIDSPGKERIARSLVARGCRGVKLHAFIQRFDPSDARFDGLYDFMNESGMTLFLHTGFDQWYGMTFPPERIERIIARRPNMAVVLVHMIFPKIDDALRLLDTYGNVVLDATNVPGALAFMRDAGMAEESSLRDRFAAGVERHRERIMYGSDYPVGMGTLEKIGADLRATGIGVEAVNALTLETPGRLIKFLRKGFQDR